MNCEMRVSRWNASVLKRSIIVGTFIAAPLLLGDACTPNNPNPPPVNVNVSVVNTSPIDLQATLSYGGGAGVPATVVQLGVVPSNSKQTITRSLSLPAGQSIEAKADVPLGALVDDQTQTVPTPAAGAPATLSYSLAIRGNYYDPSQEEQQLENAFGDEGKVQHGAFPAALGLAQAFHNILGSVEIFDPGTASNPYGTVALVYSPAALGHVFSETTALYSGANLSTKVHMSQDLEAKAAASVPAILQFGLNGGGSTEYEFDTSVSSLGSIGTSDDYTGSLLTALENLPPQDRTQICNRLATDSNALLIHVIGLYGFQSASFVHTEAKTMQFGDSLSASSFVTQSGSYNLDATTTTNTAIGPAALNVLTETPNKADICPAILPPPIPAQPAHPGAAGMVSAQVSTPAGMQQVADLVGLSLPSHLNRIAIHHPVASKKVRILYENVSLPRNALTALSKLAGRPKL